MKIGAVFPQTELPTDAGAVRDFVQGVEDLGYHHLLAYDHVLGADPQGHAPWNGPYDVDSTFREPFVLFAFVAAISSLEVVPAVIVLPQRQTALVAKQAADLDLLSEGRLRLGVGIGWNAVEYQALGQSFASRGARLEEQVGLLRRLWSEHAVTHEGNYDRIVAAGLAPRPERHVPIWIGGRVPAALRRAGSLGDGWFPMGSLAEGEADRLHVAEGARRSGRDIDELGMEPRVVWTGDPDALVAEVAGWRALGATHASIITMGSGRSGVDQHLSALAAAADALGLSGAGSP